MSNLNVKTPSMIGGILLVTGNIIGTGILALPIATSQLGLPYAIIMLFAFWLLMLLGAYYYLEANLALPPGKNLISMSRLAFGKPGVVIAWIANLLVMYSLISAYLSGGGDLIKTNLNYLGITLPSWIATVFFLFIFGFIVSRGINVVDYLNRPLMILKGIIFTLLISGLAMHADFSIIAIPQQNISVSLLIIIITSYGFATLIPSLRTYYQSDVKKIKKIIFISTFISFICYVLWITFVFSVLPYHGNNGLQEIANSTHPLSDLQLALNQALHVTWITQSMNLFSAICIITSFMANSISLTDFIADGCNLTKNHSKAWLIYLITYLPPIWAVLFYQKAFIYGLSIAGMIAIIQLLILPGLIVWRFRYSRNHFTSTYFVAGGKLLLILLLTASCIPLFLSLAIKS